MTALPRQQAGKPILASTINAIADAAETVRDALPRQTDRGAEAASEVSAAAGYVEVSRQTTDVAVSILDTDGNVVGTATYAVATLINIRGPDGVVRPWTFNA